MKDWSHIYHLLRKYKWIMGITIYAGNTKRYGDKKVWKWTGGTEEQDGDVIFDSKQQLVQT